MTIQKESEHDYKITNCGTEKECIQACRDLIEKLGWEAGQVVDGKVTEFADYRVSITENNGNYSYMAFVCRRFENIWNKVAVYEHPEHGAIALP